MWKSMRLALIVVLACTPLVTAELTGGFGQRGGVHDRPPRRGADDDHRIRRGELLRVVLYDVAGPDTETSRDCRVDDEGNITLPLVKPVRAAGRTIVDVEKAIQRAYRDEKLIEEVALRVELVKPTTRPAGKNR